MIKIVGKKNIMTNKFTKLTVCLDMAGGPNHCRHCWLGHHKNMRLTADELRFVAEAFRPFSESLEVASWFREPDYLDNYKELWRLENELSNIRTVAHWDLCSFWRAVRDPDYVPWLASLGVKACQLTLFGGREMTDYYTGRRGAYDEIVRTIDFLIGNGIAPRIQAFLFRDNADDLQSVVDLIADMELEERCAAIGRPFAAFVHQGSCDGTNAERNRLYKLRATPEDVAKIPPLLVQHSLRHWNVETLQEIFGQSEQELFAKLKDDRSTKSLVSDSPVFYVNNRFNVYPNHSEPSPHWCLGNLKTDGAEAVVTNYKASKSAAQSERLTVPISEMVRKCGDSNGKGLFGVSDYEMYILSRYLEMECL